MEEDGDLYARGGATESVESERASGRGRERERASEREKENEKGINEDEAERHVEVVVDAPGRMSITGPFLCSPPPPPLPAPAPPPPSFLSSTHPVLPFL